MSCRLLYCPAITSRCHQGEGRAEGQTHCHADTGIARRPAVGNKHTQAGGEAVVLPQLVVTAVLDVVVVLFRAVVQAVTETLAGSGETWQEAQENRQDEDCQHTGPGCDGKQHDAGSEDGGERSGGDGRVFFKGAGKFADNATRADPAWPARRLRAGTGERTGVGAAAGGTSAPHDGHRCVEQGTVNVTGNYGINRLVAEDGQAGVSRFSRQTRANFPPGGVHPGFYPSPLPAFSHLPPQAGGRAFHA